MALTALKQDSLSDLPWVHSSWSFGSPSPRCFSLPNSVAELVLCSVCSRIRISSKTENKLHTAYKCRDAFSERSPRLPRTLFCSFSYQIWIGSPSPSSHMLLPQCLSPRCPSSYLQQHLAASTVLSCSSPHPRLNRKGELKLSGLGIHLGFR